MQYQIFKLITRPIIKWIPLSKIQNLFTQMLSPLHLLTSTLQQMNFLKKTLPFCALLLLYGILLPPSVQAYFSTFDTGYILPKNTYKLGLATQLGDSSNFTSRFDYPINKSSSLRALLGTGDFILHTGVQWKWVPISDYDTQPAIGLITGIIYGRKLGINTWTVQTHPFISKKYESSKGFTTTPYLATPIGLAFSQNTVETPLHVVLGSEWKLARFKKVKFLSEFGFRLDESATYFSIGTTIEWDSETPPTFH